jgi:hypothetical protein
MLATVLGYEGDARYIYVTERSPQGLRIGDGALLGEQPGVGAVWRFYLAHPSAAALRRVCEGLASNDPLSLIIDRREHLCAVWPWSHAYSWVWWQYAIYLRRSDRTRGYQGTGEEERIAALTRWLRGSA